MDKRDELARILFEREEEMKSFERVAISYVDGRKVYGKMVMNFDCDQNKYMYFVFTAGEKDCDGLLKCYAAKYNLIDSVLQGKGLEFTDSMVQGEIDMITDAMAQTLSQGLFKKKPTAKLVSPDQIADVEFFK